jgi:hypothetical protein
MHCLCVLKREIKALATNIYFYFNDIFLIELSDVNNLFLAFFVPAQQLMHEAGSGGQCDQMAAKIVFSQFCRNPANRNVQLFRFQIEPK